MACAAEPPELNFPRGRFTFAEGIEGKLTGSVCRKDESGGPRARHRDTIRPRCPSFDAHAN